MKSGMWIEPSQKFGLMIERKGKNPLSKIHIIRMVDAVGIGNTNQKIRDRALLLVGFYSAIQRLELLHLKESKVEIMPDGGLLDLVKNKMD